MTVWRRSVVIKILSNEKHQMDNAISDVYCHCVYSR